MEKGDIKIRIAKDPKDFSYGKDIILEYADSLGFDLSFQNFDDEINNLQEMYSEPHGCLLLASINNKIVGVAGIRQFEKSSCELKRMYVKPEYRKLGIGRLLLKYSIEISRKLNYTSIKLDTIASMKTAIKLYLDYGFKEIPPYRYNPNESARYFELTLK
jgi:ribosomal protein S18 acetylase RimI-like enzyme